MIAKELRALLPVWVAVAGAMVVSALVRDLRPFNAPAYFIGAAALGAMAMGHEYSHRTMALVLTQPVSRRRVLLTKLAVLAALLLGLAWLSTIAVPLGRGERVFGTAARWLPAIAALFITPLLTLATRSPIGGAVLTLGLCGVLVANSEWIAIQRYGFASDVDGFRVQLIWRGLMLFSAGAAALLWWTFPRLQVVDGRGEMLDLAPAAGGSSQALTRRHPIWLLLGKELRLQQLSFVVAAVYVVVYVAILMSTRGLFDQTDAIVILSMLYAAGIAVVIGSIASAEERHLRTIDAQLLLPMRTSGQWLVKVSVVFGLTLVLAIVLPTALTTVFPLERIGWTVAAHGVLGLMALASMSLYVSTLCASGLWALVASMSAAFGTATFVIKLGEVVQGRLSSLDAQPDWSVVRWAAAAAVIAVTGSVLNFALANHRSADRSRARLASQVAIMGAATIAAAVVVLVVGMLSR